MFVCLYVVSIRLALIPDDATYGELLHGQYGGLEEIAWFVGMSLELVGRLAHVLCRTFTHPWLYEVVLCPVAKDGRKLELEHAARYPCLGGRTSHGIADKSYGHLEAVLKHTAEVICYGREAGRRLWCALRPLSVAEILQMVQRVEHRGIPLHGVGAPAGLHVVEADVGVIGQWDVLPACSRLVEHKLHV